MLSKLINTQIYNDVNNLNKLKYLNDKNKKIHKYNNINIKEKKFFNIKNKIVLLDKTNENNENEDKKNEYIINKNIKKINNVYKINYKNSESSGFGDFIRGCYFLLEFCEKRNIDVDFYIHDNNVKYFLKHFLIKPNINNFIANNIKRYTKSNCDFIETYGVINYEINNNNYGDFIDYLNSCNVYSNNIFMNTINFPSHNISTKHINYMKQLLEPIESFKVELDNKLHNLGLEKHNFNVYHIRLGDKYLNNNNYINNTIEIKVLNKILNNLNINNAENYLIISDSILIKNILISKYSNIKTTIGDFSHTTNNNINELKNTLFDFYLMSYSKNIVSFSVYPHGTGFSKWCSITYEIPYICYSLF